MILIKVLGPGCPNCEMVERHAIEAVGQLTSKNQDFEAVIEKVKDPEIFVKYGLLATPGLVINDRLVSAGKIPSTEEIATWLKGVE